MPASRTSPVPKNNVTQGAEQKGMDAKYHTGQATVYSESSDKRHNNFYSVKRCFRCFRTYVNFILYMFTRASHDDDRSSVFRISNNIC
jgi:hypothetical protein